MGVIRRDFTRNRHPFTRAVLASFRFANWTHYRLRRPVLRRLILGAYRAENALVFLVLNGPDLPAGARVGGGLYFPHFGTGVVINERSIIGEDVTIFQARDGWCRQPRRSGRAKHRGSGGDLQRGSRGGQRPDRKRRYHRGQCRRHLRCSGGCSRCRGSARIVDRPREESSTGGEPTLRNR